MIGNGQGASGFTNGVNNDIVGTAATPVNALLGPLQANGGPTFTHALLFGSPALQTGSNPAPVLTTDQRGPGFPRLVGAGVDIGAIESEPSLAVTLAFFAAQGESDRIVVLWETVSEANNAGFNLYRSASPAAPDALLAYVPSQAPGSTQGASYSFDDTQVAPGQRWYYWLEDVDLNGATTLHDPVSATIQAPTAVTLDALAAALIAAAGVLGVRRKIPTVTG